MSDAIELRSIETLRNLKFIIPNYQRGYRWERQQVRDLLNDIAEFMEKTNDLRDDFYCLQPLVVCETIINVDAFIEALPRDTGNALQKTKEMLEKYVEWEVIDGQQRLTTTHMLLSALEGEHPFSIRYVTRKKSASFLEPSTDDEAENDIDGYYMREARNEINMWFDKKSEEYKKKFKEVLLSKVQFIWYESSDDPIKVFTRLNIGKIELTNSELIKALLLNRANFSGDDAAKIRLRQIEIATRWDQIETMLQDDEFWLFLNKPGDTNPTRIDFIFDLICEQKMFDIKCDEEAIGTDSYRTFRYFNAYFKSKKVKQEDNEGCASTIEICWGKVDEIFAMFKEWFDDLQLYHYIGFLINQNTAVQTIYKKWKEASTKLDFLNNYLIPEIKEKIKGCSNLNMQYKDEQNEESSKAPHKTICRPLLLLHNIQTVINQNTKKSSDENSKVFYKFPFHLYKTEGWDIEHIDSNSTNEMDDEKTRIEFLANAYAAVSPSIQEKIIKFCEAEIDANENQDAFSKLQESIDKELGHAEGQNKLGSLEKNKIWNFALLDSTTNRSYGNSIFSAKRRIIIGKDKGRYLPLAGLVKKKDRWMIEQGKETDAPSSFIPPCTRNAFLKYYSTVASSPNYWLKSDAEAYLQDIFTTLEIFGVTKGETL